MRSSLGTIVYLIVCVLIASSHHYFSHTGGLKPIASAALARYSGSVRATIFATSVMAWDLISPSASEFRQSKALRGSNSAQRLMTCLKMAERSRKSLTPFKASNAG